MNSKMAQSWVDLIGRVLIAYLFIPAGWSKIAGFSRITDYIASKGGAIS